MSRPAMPRVRAFLQLEVSYNDGFIAFLNGEEIARRNMGFEGMYAFRDQLAYLEENGSATETIDVGVANSLLLDGENTLSIQVHNHSVEDASGSTLLLSADLKLQSGAVLASDTSQWKYFPGLAEPSGGLIDYGLLNTATGFFQPNLFGSVPPTMLDLGIRESVPLGWRLLTTTLIRLGSIWLPRCRESPLRFTSETSSRSRQ